MIQPKSKPARKTTLPGPTKEFTKSEEFYLVGIGASAGGLEALEQFFTHMPAHSDGMAFILVTHLDPSHESMMSELMKRFTKMNVLEAKDGIKIKPDYVYVIPPNKDMAIYHGTLHLSAPAVSRGMRMPIDFFFRSLAEDRGEKAICIILSGTGTDGTMGMRAVHGAGGLCIVQDPASARYDGMPQSAINTGFADYILPPGKMPDQLVSYAKFSYPAKTRKQGPFPGKPSRSFDKILMTIRSQTGHDFSLYKKSTIHRRLEKRMSLHEIEDVSIYLRYLQEHRDEVQILFKELLISVTNFFRDPEAFEVLKRKVIPKLLQNKPGGHTFRVWAPGCASGEEAYSIAMILRELAEEKKLDFRFQIFATDIDENAIDTARSGIYPGNIAIDVTPERLKHFFTKEGNAYRIKKEIRDAVIFAVQNVIRDTPFTKLDLISCRNLLIYLDTELQEKLIPLFHYSLKPGGILFLGSSESIGKFVDLFSIIEKKWRFFQRKESISSYQTMLFTGLPWAHERPPGEIKWEAGKLREVSIEELTQKLLLENFAPPCVIINEKGEILYVQGRTGKYLEPPSGQATLNIQDMAREGLGFELRSAIHKAISQKKDIILRDIQVKTNGGFQPVRLSVRHINEPETMKGLMMVVFEDIPVKKGEPAKAREKTAGVHNKRIEELERELKYTRENLQATIEELQASNEELKSTNEELQSTNEELQSTNEELETSREEMQSINEELVTVNSELQAKIDQLTRAENDMRNLFDSTNIGIIFLDAELNISRFTPEATKMINLIPTDVGRPISHIASNMKYDNLVDDAKKVLDTLVYKETEVQIKNGNWCLVRIIPYRTVDNLIDGVVVSFIDITQLKQTTEELRKLNKETQAAREFAESVIATVREPLLVLDADLRVLSASRSFLKTFKVSKEETEGRFVYDLCDRQWDIPELRKLLEEILPASAFFENFKVNIEFPQIGKKTMLLNARKVISENISRPMILLAMEDSGITN